VRALLDLLRENEAAVQEYKGLVQSLMSRTSRDLNILDLVSGEKELVRLMAVELAKLSSG